LETVLPGGHVPTSIISREARRENRFGDYFQVLRQAKPQPWEQSRAAASPVTTCPGSPLGKRHGNTQPNMYYLLIPRKAEVQCVSVIGVEPCKGYTHGSKRKEPASTVLRTCSRGFYGAGRGWMPVLACSICFLNGACRTQPGSQGVDEIRIGELVKLECARECDGRKRFAAPSCPLCLRPSGADTRGVRN
jgi:hypothetical protein